MTEPSGNEIAELRRKISVLEQDVQHLVSHDQLTGLLIRSALLKRVERHLAEGSVPVASSVLSSKSASVAFPASPELWAAMWAIM
jgi:GGDEF domain-containing protein